MRLTVSVLQTSRTVVMSQDTLTQMVRDISAVDFADLCSQAGFMDPSANPKFSVKMQECELP